MKNYGEKKKIKIAIIDSGVSRHEKIDDSRVKYKLNITATGTNENVEDLNGHGTAITSILSSESKFDLYILKILDEKNDSTVNQLIKALYVCIDKNVHIINLSLGTEDFSKYDEIKKVCELARKKNIFIVSACNNSGKKSLPYDLDCVLKVRPYLCIKNNEVMYYDGVFIARGMPHMLAYIKNKYMLVGGSSFATPYVTLALGKFLNKYNGCYNDVLKKFISECKKLERVDDFYPIDSIVKSNYNNDTYLYKIVSDVIDKIIGKSAKDETLLKQGINKYNPFSILKGIENCIKYKLPYDEFNMEDFAYKENLTNKIELIISKNKYIKKGEIYEKVN